MTKGFLLSVLIPVLLVSSRLGFHWQSAHIDVYAKIGGPSESGQMPSTLRMNRKPLIPKPVETERLKTLRLPFQPGSSDSASAMLYARLPVAPGFELWIVEATGRFEDTPAERRIYGVLLEKASGNAERVIALSLRRVDEFEETESASRIVDVDSDGDLDILTRSTFVTTDEFAPDPNAEPEHTLRLLRWKGHGFEEVDLPPNDPLISRYPVRL